jgi:hypothetical protein
MAEQQELIAQQVELTFPIIVLPTTQAMLTKIQGDLDESRDLVIDSPAMADIALELAGRFATVRSAMDAERLEKTKPLRDGQATINGGYNPAIEFVERAERDVKAKLTAWNNKVRQQRADAEAQARKQQAEAKAKAEAEATAQRQAAEKLAADAQAALQAGNTDQAAELMTQAQVQADVASQTASAAVATVMPIVAAPATVKGARETWKARVVNKADFILHVAGLLEKGDLSLLECIDLNMPALNKLAGAQKGGMSVRGVESYAESSISVRKGAV